MKVPLLDLKLQYLSHKKELDEAEDKAKLKKDLAQKYRNEIANPYVAEDKGYIDEVIDPAVTRTKLISAFQALENKHVYVPDRRHGNIPL